MSKKVHMILKIALAYSLVRPAVAGFINPDAWIGFIPQFVSEIVPVTTFLIIFGVVEIILGLLIISMKDIFYPSILAGLLILSIILFNLSQSDIIFRDVAILGIVIALALNAWEKRNLIIKTKI